MTAILRIWNQTENWFRDRSQADAVGEVIMTRLADDREQDECRYLARLKWHFHMGYQEVSFAELKENVSETKMWLLQDLFDEIAAANYQAIDEWVQRCQQALPIITDKSYSIRREAESEE
jgi:hypothetical protein